MLFVAMNRPTSAGSPGEATSVGISSGSSKNSAVVLPPTPPAINTCPVDKRVAVWNARSVVKDSVAENSPVVGSKSSAVEPPATPPATST